MPVHKLDLAPPGALTKAMLENASDPPALVLANPLISSVAQLRLPSDVKSIDSSPGWDGLNEPIIVAALMVVSSMIEAMQKSTIDFIVLFRDLELFENTRNDSCEVNPSGALQVVKNLTKKTSF